MSFEYYTKIINVTGKEELSYLPLIRMIRFKNVMNEIKIPDPPPTLKATCSSFYCICWKCNKKSCTFYNKCIKCNNTTCEC
jgi:hypothetical protein